MNVSMEYTIIYLGKYTEKFKKLQRYFKLFEENISDWYPLGNDFFTPLKI